MSGTTLNKGLALGALGIGASSLGLYSFLKSKSSDLPRDLSTIFQLVKLSRFVEGRLQQEWNIRDLFAEAVQKNPDGEAIIFLESPPDVSPPITRSLTFRELDILSNKISNWALSEQLKSGDVVALMMDSCPEFLIYWLGFMKIGVCLALINFNLKGAPLQHSLSVCKANYYFIGMEHIAEVEKVRYGSPSTKGQAIAGKFFSVGGEAPNYQYIDPIVHRFSGKPPPPSCQAGRRLTDNLLYIYTSGTTGNPKASVIKHLRFLLGAATFSESLKIGGEDRIYCCLPLYHSAAGVIGLGMSWYSAVPLVIRKKFSARVFWSDCHYTKSTVIQYIGELCRYLLNHPPSPFDKNHVVRIAVGNGLRPDIWKQFQERFSIPQIAEFYGSTEGNAFLINYLNKVGAVGFITPLIRAIVPSKLVKFDTVNEVPIRGKDGFCIECEVGEVGELLGLIDQTNSLRKFDGYTEKAATEKKIIRDVFKKGDMYFRTGDLLRSDKEGFMYFIDRVGDTFRWRGENVSTNEVGEVLSAFPGVQQANVYGVTVPNQDGRAGMACLVVDDINSFDLDKFYTYIKEQLPSYAAPLFIRFQTDMDTTSTFKYKKNELVAQGFDPNIIQDKLYLRDETVGKFIPLDEHVFKKITSVQAKL